MSCAVTDTRKTKCLCAGGGEAGGGGFPQQPGAACRVLERGIRGEEVEAVPRAAQRHEVLAGALRGAQ